MSEVSSILSRPENWLFFALLAGTLIFLLWLFWGLKRKSLEAEALTTKTLQIDAGEVRYHRSGSGPHVLLLHGIGASLSCWRHLVPLLNSDFTVTAVDLIGFGQSSKPIDVDYTLDFQVKCLTQISEKLKIEKAIVVGNSMGGNIGLWLALKHPEFVARLVLIAPATSPKLVPLKLDRHLWLAYPASAFVNRAFVNWAYRRTLGQAERLSAAHVDETFGIYKRQPHSIRSFLRATAAIRDPRLLIEVHNLKVPVLTLWGEFDRLVPWSVIELLAKRIPSMKVYVHSSGGHHLQEDFPEWVSEKIQNFVLEKLD